MSLVFFLNLVLGRRCGVQNYISKKVSASQSEFYVCWLFWSSSPGRPSGNFLLKSSFYNFQTISNSLVPSSQMLWLSIIHVKACYHLVGRVSLKVIGGTFLWYSDCLTGVTLLRPRYEESWQETEPSCIDMFQSDWSGQTSHCSLGLWSVSIRAKWCIILHFWVECFQDWQIRSCYLVSIRSFNSSKAAHTSGVAQLTTDESDESWERSFKCNHSSIKASHTTAPPLSTF